MMKAIVQHEYGAPHDVLKLVEVDTPAVGETEVLVRVRASSANPWDWHFIRGEPVLMRPAGIGGIRKPKIPDPRRRPGRYGRAGRESCDRVRTRRSCLRFRPWRVRRIRGGAAGEPRTQAGEPDLRAGRGRAPGRLTAIQGLRAGGLQAGQHVLVIGASGGVGTFAVQIAKHFGAEVTGVCSTGNLDLVRRLGADHVIDYTKQDIFTGPARYDMVFQLGGTYSPVAIRKVLTPHGTLIQSYGDGNRWFGPLGNIIKAAVLSLFVGQTLKAFTAKETTEALDEITELIEAGQLTPVIDRTYPLAAAAEAVQLVEQGRPAGKVTVTITSD